MRVTFYAGPWDGQEMKATYIPLIGDQAVTGDGGHYVYAGKGRYVYYETQEAVHVREWVQAHRRNK